MDLLQTMKPAYANTKSWEVIPWSSKLFKGLTQLPAAPEQCSFKALLNWMGCLPGNVPAVAPSRIEIVEIRGQYKVDGSAECGRLQRGKSLAMEGYFAKLRSPADGDSEPEGQL